MAGGDGDTSGTFSTASARSISFRLRHANTKLLERKGCAAAVPLRCSARSALPRQKYDQSAHQSDTKARINERTKERKNEGASEDVARDTPELVERNEPRGHRVRLDFVIERLRQLLRLVQRLIQRFLHLFTQLLVIICIRETSCDAESQQSEASIMISRGTREVHTTWRTLPKLPPRSLAPS
jgi:hypothetical protein